MRASVGKYVCSLAFFCLMFCVCAVQASAYDDDAPYYYYSGLSNDSQRVYDALVRAAEMTPGSDGEVHVPVQIDGWFDEDDFSTISVYNDAVIAFNHERPREKVACRYCHPEGRGHTMEVVVGLYDHNVERLARLDAATERFYEQFCADGMENADKVERYRYIHDYLCLLCYYNHASYEGRLKGEPQTAAHSVYGALVEAVFDTGEGRGNVVCEGYAKTYQLLCQRVGLPCLYVTGMTMMGNHAWNYIYVDGNWYGVDVTWDDIDAEGWSSEEILWERYWEYTYFGNNALFAGEERDHDAEYNDGYTYVETPKLNPAIALETSEEESSERVFYRAELADNGKMAQLMYARNMLWKFGKRTEFRLAGNAEANLIAYPVTEGYELIVTGVTGSRIVKSEERGENGGYWLDVTYPERDPTNALFHVWRGGRLILSNIAVAEDMYPLAMAEGAISLSGWIDAPIDLGETGTIEVTGSLSGNIPLMGFAGQIAVSPAEGYQWTAADRAVFRSADDALALSFDSGRNALVFVERAETPETDAVSVRYLAGTDGASVASAGIVLRNRSAVQQCASVLLAAYNEAGRLIEVLNVAVESLASGEQKTISLEAPDGGCRWRLLVLNKDGLEPLASGVFWMIDHTE